MTHSDWERPDLVSLMSLFWKNTLELRPEFSRDLAKEGLQIYKDWLDSINSISTISNIEEAVLAMAKASTLDEFYNIFQCFQGKNVNAVQAIDCYAKFRCELENYLTKFNLTAGWCVGYAERQLWYWLNNGEAFARQEVFAPVLPAPFSEEKRLQIERDVQFSAKYSGGSNRASKLGNLTYWENLRWKCLISALADLLASDKRVPVNKRWRLTFFLKPEFWIRCCINGLDDELLIDLFRNGTPWLAFPFFDNRERILMPDWMSDEQKRQLHYDNNPQEIPTALQFHFRDFWWIDNGEERKQAEKRIQDKFRADLKKYLDCLEKDGIRPLLPEEFGLVPDEEIDEMYTEQNPKIRNLHIEWAVRRIVPPIESKYDIDGCDTNHTKEIGIYSNSIADELGLEILGSNRKRGKTKHN